MRNPASLVLTLAAGVSAIGFVEASPDGPPIPNTDCDDTTLHLIDLSYAVSATKQSTDFSDMQDDYDQAESDALDLLKRKLGRNSGIVCEICPEDRVQCERLVFLDSQSILPAPEIIMPDYPNHDGGWSIGLFYDAEFHVACAGCEEIPSSPGEL